MNQPYINVNIYIGGVIAQQNDQLQQKLNIKLVYRSGKMVISTLRKSIFYDRSHHAMLKGTVINSHLKWEH